MEYKKLIASIISGSFLVLGATAAFTIFTGAMFQITTYAGILLAGFSVFWLCFITSRTANPLLLRALLIGYTYGIFIGLTLLIAGVIHA